LGVAGALLGVSACDTMSGAARSGAVETRTTASAMRDPVLEDIPKPAGFRLVDDGTFGVFSGKVRIARCQYVGPTECAAIKRFYEEYMPSAGFELRGWSVDAGVFNLHFESTSEVCNVRISPGARSGSALVVEVKPKPQGKAERQTPPPLRRPE